MDFQALKLQPKLSGVSMHATVRSGRPVPSDNGPVRGSRYADDYDHDDARAMLAVLHDDDQQHDDDNGRPVRDGILCVGLGAIAWSVVAARVFLSVAVPVRDSERQRDRRVSAGADAMHGDDDDNHEHDDEHDDNDNKHDDYDDVLPGLSGRRLRANGL